MASNLVPNCDLQARLSSLYECSLIGDYSKRVMVSRALNSEFFNDGLKAVLQDINGQTMTVKVIHKTQYEESDITEGCNGTPCSSSAAPKGNASTTISMPACDADYTDYVTAAFEMEDYRAKVQFADNPSSIDAPINPNPNGNALEQEFWAMMEALDIKKERRLVTQLVGNVNTDSYGFSQEEALDFSGSNYGKIVKTFGNVPTGFNVKGDLSSEVLYSAEAANFCSSPLVIGAKPVYEYLKQMDSGCCNTSGIDLGDFMSKHPITFVNSNFLGQEFTTLYSLTGANAGVNAPYFLSLERGAVKILSYQEYNGGIFAMDMPYDKRFTLRSPVSGRYINVSIHIDTCYGSNGKVIVSLSSTEKVITIPEQFASSDYRYGVNGIQQFKIVNS